MSISKTIDKSITLKRILEPPYKPIVQPPSSPNILSPHLNHTIKKDIYHPSIPFKQSCISIELKLLDKPRIVITLGNFIRDSFTSFLKPLSHIVNIFVNPFVKSNVYLLKISTNITMHICFKCDNLIPNRGMQMPYLLFLKALQDGLCLSQCLLFLMLWPWRLKLFLNFLTTFCTIFIDSSPLFFVSLCILVCLCKNWTC